MDVAVVGAGRLGTAVAVLLGRAGHRIVAVAGGERTAERAARYLPNVPFVDVEAAPKGAELVVLGVPDARIRPTAERLADAGAFRAGAWVAHLSGATGLDALAPARAAAARPLALHPLQTFPDVEGALARIPGCPIGVTAEDDEGFETGEGLARDVGGRPFRLADDAKPLYHAAAVFASNYVIASIAVADRLLALAGVRDEGVIRPLVAATVENVERLGPGRALTGPAVRGDAGTVERNLEAVAASAADAVEAYVALARQALRLGVDAGRLEPAGRERVEEVLARWS